MIKYSSKKGMIIMEIGKKIANTRKELGITQVELADKMAVTRQTVSRWESGAALPDVEKISQIATILNVSCDYLLKDDVENSVEEKTYNNSAITRLFQNLAGKNVKISFYDDEEDYELLDKVCKVEEIEGNWVKVTFENKQKITKLVAVSSILSIEIIEENGGNYYGYII